MAMLRKVLLLLHLGFSTLRQRMGPAAVIIVGIAGVVAVLVALFAMAEGYRQTLGRTGNDETAVVMRGASAAEVMSGLDRASVALVSQADGIRKNDKGEPLASDEMVVAANLPVRNGGPDEEGSVQFRGVGDLAFAVRPQVKIVAGRRPTPGLRELVVGRGAARQFAGLEPGRKVRLGSEEWVVTGVFASGDAMESEIWGDVNVVADTYKRGSSRNSVTVRLTDPSVFPALKKALETNPQLQVDASTTAAYYAKQSEGMVMVIRIVGIVVGAIMAIGALFGALNTMFAAVAARAREIATLRAIGFSGFPVVLAIMAETMLLALVGGAIGGALAWLIFDGYSASTLAGGAVGKLSFEFKVTPALLATGLEWALVIGLLGGLLPALRAARMPVAGALREL